MVNEAEYAQPELHNGLESIARGKITASGEWMNHHENSGALCFSASAAIYYFSISFAFETIGDFISQKK